MTCVSVDFVGKINHDTVELETLSDPVEIAYVKNLILEHYNYTKSELASKILGNFNYYLKNFVKVIPTDYKKVLLNQAADKIKEKQLSTSEYLKRFQRTANGKADATNGEVDAMVSAKKKENSISYKSTAVEHNVYDLEDSNPYADQLFKNADKCETLEKNR